MSASRVLYYAVGGGLGHLVRARAVLHTLHLESVATILASSPQAGDRRVTGDVPVVTPPDGLLSDGPAYRGWIAEQVKSIRPDALFVDAFPAGLVGELVDLAAWKTLEKFYIARLLRWSEYERLVPTSRPRFSRTYVLESLHPDHERFVSEASIAVTPLSLVDPPRPDPVLPESIATMSDYWLLVHSGPLSEVAALIAYAKDIMKRERAICPLVVCTLAAITESADVKVIDYFPAADLFPRARDVVTACGFNAMREARALGSRHHCLPLPRRYDDQFTRAARIRGSRA
jgi:hypothetical protein